MYTFSAMFLTALVEHLPFFVAVKDAATRRYVLVNQSFCDHLGRPRDELLGKSDMDLLGEEYAKEQQAVEDRTVATGSACTVPEVPFRDERGERTLSVSLVPLSETGKGISHILISGEDITGRKITEWELAAQKDFIRQVIDTDPNLIFVKDYEGNFVLANQALADLYGMTVKEITNKNNADVNSNPDEVEAYARVDREVVATLREVRAVDPVTLKDGSKRWHYTIKRPLTRSTGEVQILSICIDVTELKEARGQAELATRELERKAEEAAREARAKTELAEALDRKLEVIEQQSRSIRALSTPLLDIGGHVLGVPLIGIMDEARAVDVADRLLRAVSERHVRHIVLDLTGLEAANVRAVQHLLRIAGAVRLLGATVTITGISPALATTMSELEVDLSGVVTMASLHEALNALTSPRGAAERRRSPSMRARNREPSG
jgi:PAS domain S-box-containing protein